MATVADIDTVMREGLGPRWSILGPFETVDLNTRGGIASHAQKMGPAYERMGAERGQHDPWTPALVAEVTRQRQLAAGRLLDGLLEQRLIVLRVEQQDDGEGERNGNYRQQASDGKHDLQQGFHFPITASGAPVWEGL